jgi:HPt (histidine-containing phosphotransfer) domain-containing protein
MSSSDNPDTPLNEADHLPLSDPQGLAPLATVLDEDKVLKIVGLCLDDTREKTDLIIHAADVENWNEICGYAHDIKSNTGQIGASRLQGLARQLETCCRDGNVENVPQLVANFKASLVLTEACYADDKLLDFVARAKACSG